MHRSYLFFLISDYVNYAKRNYTRFKDVVRKKNLVYDDRFGNFTKADIFYKEKKEGEKRPVFVNFHGGGFVRGDKKLRKSFCAMVANEGWFVVNANYRTAGKHFYPSVVEDGINCLNFVVSIAKEYDLDLNKVVVSGDSAGAYNAAELVSFLTNADMRENLKLPTCSIKLAGFAGFCGPYDMEKVLYGKFPFAMNFDIGECMLGFKIDKDFKNVMDYKYRKELSPINWTNADWPYTFLASAKHDMFCGGQGELIHEKLESVGVKVKAYHGQGKEFHCFHLDFFRPETKACLAVFKEYLKEIAES